MQTHFGCFERLLTINDSVRCRAGDDESFCYLESPRGLEFFMANRPSIAISIRVRFVY